MFGVKFPPLPFLTRKMLNFEHGNTIQLEIRSQARTATVVTIRGMTREGIFSFNHTTAISAAVTTQRFSLPDIPIMGMVVSRGSSLNQGNTYIVLNLLVAGELVQELSAGMVYADKGISWPNPSRPDRIPNMGEILEITGNDPAAGAEISMTIANNRAVRILWLRFRLITDANVANRRVHIRFSTSFGLDFDTFAADDQTASQDRFYTIAAFPSMPASAHDNDILIPIPPNLILTGDATIATQTNNLQAGDNWGLPDGLAEGFFEIT